ncbi:MAG: hypothetical protein Q4C50_06645 [Eubacteriales bacterium]|nr:hypothetical protein [Eubacteriales bacterium]
MRLTILLSSIMMAGLFLMLLAGVGFIQDKRFFASAPKEALDVIQPREERFPGAHAIGWLIGIISLVMMGGALAYGGWDGIRNGFTFWQFYGRFLTMLLLLKVFDILFFDWFLLCRSNFFQHFYPEVTPYYGPHLFGYNKKTHITHVILFVPASALMSAVCLLF